MPILRFQLRVLWAAAVGAVIGMTAVYLTGWAQSAPPSKDEPPPGSMHLPYPHVVPKTKDGVALRYAMVHDVIHERYPRHGQAYYKERNRKARQALEAIKTRQKGDQPTQEYFDLLDDLAVGLDMVGEYDQAIQVLRDKLRQQQELGFTREKMYSTHANLGTLLILGPFRKVRPGSAEDKARLREGLGHIQTAITINPDSHFGREKWQAVIIEYMIALYDRPELLLEFDMLGNRLANDLDGTDGYAITDFGNHLPAAGPTRWGVALGGVKHARWADEYLKQPASWGENVSARQAIAKIGAEGMWSDFVLSSSHQNPVPFDEPVLGIVGMWRLGGGAHPYFAVALGETMLRVGQRYLAWNAFERAALMANVVWPDEQIQKDFANHCRLRQAVIEATLSAEEVDRLRPAFEAELALGLEYQKAYQRYEEDQIKAGKSIDDPQFYVKFEAERGPIATPVGNADWFHASYPRSHISVFLDGINLSKVTAMALFFAGVFALTAACWPSRRAPRTE